MRVTSKLISKKSLTFASVAVSTLVFASGTYAMSSSSVLVSDNFDGSVENAVDTENGNPSSEQQSSDDVQSVVESTSSDSSGSRSNESVTSTRVSIVHENNTSHNSDYSSPGNTSRDEPTRPERANQTSVTVNEGSESENDSNVRIRVRNSSSSDLNGDEQATNGSFSLEINEDTSAH